MAIQCPNCGKELSDNAAVCTECGMQFANNQQTPAFAGMYWQNGNGQQSAWSGYGQQGGQNSYYQQQYGNSYQQYNDQNGYSQQSMNGDRQQYQNSYLPYQNNDSQYQNSYLPYQNNDPQYQNSYPQYQNNNSQYQNSYPQYQNSYPQMYQNNYPQQYGPKPEKHRLSVPNPKRKKLLIIGISAFAAIALAVTLIIVLTGGSKVEGKWLVEGSTGNDSALNSAFDVDMPMGIFEFKDGTIIESALGGAEIIGTYDEKAKTVTIKKVTYRLQIDGKRITISSDTGSVTLLKSEGAGL